MSHFNTSLRIDYGFEPLDCFTGDLDEEFYDSSQSSIATPGKDIWSKFDIEEMDSLYPTPPLSPERSDSPDTGDGDGGGGGCRKDMILEQSSDRLSQVLASLEDEPVWMTQTFSFNSEGIITASKGTEHTSSNKIKRDCMWSTWKRFLQDNQAQTSETKCSAQKDSKPTDHSNPQTDCVDPAAVFPYPLSETRLDLNFGCPATPSDSEEEVDVVTVAREDKVIEERLHPKIIVKEVKEIQYSCHRMSSTPPHDYARPKPKHTRVIIRNSKRPHDSSHSVLSNKKRKHSKVDYETLKKALQKLGSESQSYDSPSSRKNTSKYNSRGSSRQSSHPSSDSEDSERRVNHNVLERKRRDDLRHAFFKLRDQVPDLKMQERAAKVVILKKAREYVEKLRLEEGHRSYAKRQLQDEQRRLQRKLKRLKDQIKNMH